jgi:hypothetical protein
MELSGCYNYFSAVSASSQELGRVSKLEYYIKYKPLQFFYGDASYSIFAESLCEYEWESRKLLAIPKALYSGIYLTILHIFCALFYGLPDAYDGRFDTIQAYASMILRDQIETFGYYLTFIHDKAGSFLVQGSLFHKECYTYYLTETQSGITSQFSKTPTKTPSKPKFTLTPKTPSKYPPSPNQQRIIKHISNSINLTKIPDC